MSLSDFRCCRVVRLQGQWRRRWMAFTILNRRLVELPLALPGVIDYLLVGCPLAKLANRVVRLALEKDFNRVVCWTAGESKALATWHRRGFALGFIHRHSFYEQILTNTYESIPPDETVLDESVYLLLGTLPKGDRGLWPRSRIMRCLACLCCCTFWRTFQWLSFSSCGCKKGLLA